MGRNLVWNCWLGTNTFNQSTDWNDWCGGGELVAWDQWPQVGLNCQEQVTHITKYRLHCFSSFDFYQITLEFDQFKFLEL